MLSVTLEIHFFHPSANMFSSKVKRVLSSYSNCRILFAAKNNLSTVPNRSQLMVTAKSRSLIATAVECRRVHLSSALLSTSEVEDSQDTDKVGENLELEERHIAYLSGVPWSCSFADITDFLAGCQLKDGDSSVHALTDRRGKFSGNVYIEFASADDLNRALEADMHYIQNRFVRVSSVNADIMEKRVASIGTIQLKAERNEESFVVKLRGLPFSVNYNDIMVFLEGINIVENGVSLVYRPDGKLTGQAFVQLASLNDFNRALERHREFIKDRYVEVFASDVNALHSSNTEQPKWIKMRGLPFEAREKDIEDFFHPLEPVQIEVKEDVYGRNRGQAVVEFSSHEDVLKAMEKNKDFIGSRYIELSPLSKGSR